MRMVDFFEEIYMMDSYKLRTNFPIIADGSSRTVYDIGRGLVIKRATNRDGIDQCKVENTVYSHTGEYLRGYLCPILWHAPGMIAMLKAVPVMPLDMVIGDFPIDLNITGRGHRAYGDLMYLSHKFGLLFEDLLSITSWGYIGDRAVLVDYGCRD